MKAGFFGLLESSRPEFPLVHGSNALFPVCWAGKKIEPETYDSFTTVGNTDGIIFRKISQAA